MSASMADLSIPLTAWAAGKAALLTLVQSSIFVAYPSAPAMADWEAAILTSKNKNTHVKYSATTTQPHLLRSWRYMRTGRTHERPTERLIQAERFKPVTLSGMILQLELVRPMFHLMRKLFNFFMRNSVLHVVGWRKSVMFFIIK